MQTRAQWVANTSKVMDHTVCSCMSLTSSLLLRAWVC